jgi:hypothetical protein
MVGFCWFTTMADVAFEKRPPSYPGEEDLNLILLAQGGIPDGLDACVIERYSGFGPFADPAGMGNMAL